MIETFRNRPYAARRFRAIVDHARLTNPFYRSFIKDPERPPLLDRATALENNDAILNGHPATGTTSGSIGVPVRYAHTPEWANMVAKDVNKFVKLLGGSKPCVNIVHTRGEPKNELTIPVTRPVAEQIDYILRKRDECGIRAIKTLPTNAEMLCRAVLEQGLDMSFIERFGTLAETLQDHHKELIRAAFPNAQTWETYSSMEFGLIAMVCPYEPGFYHIMAHRLGVEVLREDGTPAAMGEPGEVYVTDYFNRLAPLIRYELGDYVVRGQCPCGKIRLPALSRIMGRVSSTLVKRDGTRMFFVDLAVALREIPGVRQYKVIQNAVEEFTVRVAAEGNLDGQIRAEFQKHLGYIPDQLTTEYVDSIPRDKNGKYRVSECRI